MKNLRLGLFIFTAFFLVMGTMSGTVSADEYWSSEDSSMNFCVSVEPMLVKVTQDDLEFADLFIPDVLEEEKYFEPEWTFGYRLGLSAENNCSGWGTALRYTWFKPSMSASLSGGIVSSDIFSGEGESAEAMSANLEMEFHYVDAIVTYGFTSFCNNLFFYPYAGVRYFSYKSDYELIAIGDDFSPAPGDVLRVERKVSGPGLLFGLQLETSPFELCGCHLSFNGRLGLFYLTTGPVKTNVTFREEVNTFKASTNNSEPFGGFESALGFDIEKCFCGKYWNLGVTYEYSEWGRNFSQTDSPSFPDAVDPDSDEYVSISMFQLRLGFCF